MDVKLLESPTTCTVSLYTGEWLTLALIVTLQMTQEKPVPGHGLCHGHGNFQDDFFELLVFFMFTLLTIHFAC